MRPKPNRHFYVEQLTDDHAGLSEHASHLQRSLYMASAFEVGIMDENYIREEVAMGELAPQRRTRHAQDAVVDFFRRNPVLGANNPCTDPSEQVFVAIVRVH